MSIELSLLPTLRDTLKVAYCADFCVGYFNLRGWQKIDDLIEQFVGGESSCCRLLVGMQSLPSDEVHAAFTLGSGDPRIDNSAILRFKKRMAVEFRPDNKVLIFTQFADTVRYLTDNLKARNITKVSGVTGQSKDPTELTGLNPSC